MQKFQSAAFLEALKQRDDAAWSELLAHFYPMARKAVLKLGGSGEDARDAFQDASMVLLMRLHENRLELKSAKLSTYFWGVVTNCYYNIGKSDLSTTLPLDEKLPQEVAGEEQRLKDQRRQKLLKAFNELGELCSKILSLFYFEQLPIHEITQQMNYLNDQNTRNKKYRCLDSLRKSLVQHD